MAFSKQMVTFLKTNPYVRHEMLALKLAQNAEKRASGVIQGVKANPEAEKVFNVLKEEEKRILNSNEARQAFDQTIKPEARYAAAEDCYNRGYMQEEAFWADPHNKEFAKICNKYYMHEEAKRSPSYLQSKHSEGTKLLKRLCRKNGVKEFIKDMLNVRKAQGETPSVIPQKALKIDLSKS